MTAGPRTKTPPTGTIVNLKPELDTGDAQRLLAMVMGHPTPTRLEEVCQVYRFLPEWHVFGYRVGGDVVAFIGIQLLTSREAVIRHIAVLPQRRKQGIGRALIGHSLKRLALFRLTAETDADAVGFYHTCGFTAASLGTDGRGVERFTCVLALEVQPQPGTTP
ncbi:MAG: GNAT family N-acetyltransferase [Chloroflexi bacterium]|nr:GNAT family N-acetyltransferase [Chloroflexota bacterium]